MKKSIFLALCVFLFPVILFAQTIPADQKTWYSEHRQGVIPPTWPGDSSTYLMSNALKKTTDNTVCYAAADANCSTNVAPGAGAIWEVRVRDGNGATLSDVNLMNAATIPITDYGLNTLGALYAWDAAGAISTRMYGGAMNLATIPITNYGIDTQSAVYGFDASGAISTRVNANQPGIVAIPTTNWGLDTASSVYFYEPTGGSGGAAAFTRWNGDDMGNATYTTPTSLYSPFTQNFLYGWDSIANDRWRRIIVDASGAIVTSGSGSTKIQDGDGADLADVSHMDGSALATTLHALDVLSGENFWEAGAAQFIKWYGDDMNNATYTTPANLYSPFTQGFLYGWDSVNNDRWRRIITDATGAIVTSGSGSSSIKDGDSAVLADVIDTYADNLSTSLNGLMTASVMYGYDGVALDMLRIGAVGELQVTDVATRPGEDAANDWRKSKKQEIAVSSPAKTTTTNVADAATVILATTEVLSWPNYCVYIKNNDGDADPFTDVDYQTSPDATSFVDLTEPATCDTLAAGVMCVFCESGNAYRYIRIRATCGAADVCSSIDAWIVMNKG